MDAEADPPDAGRDADALRATHKLRFVEAVCGYMIAAAPIAQHARVTELEASYAGEVRSDLRHTAQ